MKIKPQWRELSLNAARNNFTKKLLMLCCIFCLITVPLGVAQVHAGTYGDNITVYDQAGPEDGTRGVGQGYEDQETEPGMSLNQSWDLEAFQFNKSTKKLAIIGGFDFKTGKADNSTEPLGALFIKKDPITAPPYGSSLSGSGDSHTEVDNSPTYAYTFAITFDLTNNKYTVYQAEANAKVILHGPDGKDLGDVSNPWNIGSGWTPVPNYTDLTLQYTTRDDFDGLLGGSHNVIYDIDMGFLGSDHQDNSFWAHLTYDCGNDNLMGYAANPPTGAPLPGSLLLLGSGLLGVGLVGFRSRRKGV
jgi:hypothetical protein